MTINKQDALKKMQELEKQVQELKAIIEAPEPKNAVLLCKTGQGKEPIHYLFVEGLKIKGGTTGYYNLAVPTPVFSTKQIADAYADMFNVMLELRACEGVTDTWTTHSTIIGRCGSTLYASDGDTISISPKFERPYFAEDARNKVGKERIIKAYKTLQGKYD